MLTKRFSSQVIVWVAAFGMMIPGVPGQLAAGETSQAGIRDVALTNNGLLHGQFIGTDGEPVSAALVSFAADGSQVAETVTDAEGHFELAGLQPGVYDVNVGNVSQTIRVWSHQAAPPTAATSALLTHPVVRGQYGGGSMGVIFGLTGIAIATAALVEVHNLSNRVDNDMSP